MTQEEIRKRLEELAEDNYKEFSASLIPNVKNMLGVRLPMLRNVAKEIARDDWKECFEWKDIIYFEENMLQGMVLGYAKADIEELLVYLRRFIPKIDNWSVNDSFCNSFKIAKKNQNEVWDFLMEYRESNKEYEIRIVAVMLMCYFLDDNYIDRVLEVLKELDASKYYASMGIAWAYATAWSKYPEKTKKYLKEHEIDSDTYKKTLQKCLESNKVSAEDKEYIRGIKKGMK